MQDKKYQVFISSTFIDLKDERDHAMKAVLEMGHIPIGMELFHASDETQWQLIQKRIDESDYYVLILAHRYGSADDDGIGYTEKEYDCAVVKGVPVLSFIIDESIDWQPKFIDKGKDLKKLSAFKAKASHKKMVQFWSNKDNLNSKIKSALQNQIIINPRNGWVRSDETDYKNVAGELARLSKENEELKSENVKLLKKQLNKENDIIKELKACKLKINLLYNLSSGSDNKSINLTINLYDLFIYICSTLGVNETLSVYTLQASLKKIISDKFKIEANWVGFENEDFDSLKIIFDTFDLFVYDSGSSFHSFYITDNAKNLIQNKRKNNILKKKLIETKDVFAS